MRRLAARLEPRLLPRLGVRRASTVAVGVSGGVDSALTASILRAEGHNVVGIHMRNWDASEESPDIAQCIEKEARDARRVCEEVGIGYHEVNFVREYWHDVFAPLLDGFAAGGTPNPDVSCNRLIKFDRFVDHALSLGADYVATGHYARLERAPDGTMNLLTAVDQVKDQSYFLATVKQEALRRARFPIGHLLKSDVRAMASAAGLHPAAKRDSVGICFIGKRNFSQFLSGYLPQSTGPFICVETGREIGTHNGYALYTPGQRARVSGCRQRWYVAGKDVATNVVHVCEGRDHPALFSRDLSTHAPLWSAGALPAELREGGELRCGIRYRHPGPIVPCTVQEDRDASAPTSGASDASPPLRITFEQPVHGVAPEQAIALYDGERCLGGATIHQRGRTLWEEACALHPPTPSLRTAIQ